MADAAAAPGALGQLFEHQGQDYATYRLGYSRNVFETIYAFADLPQKGLAVDVACGTGQAAVGLAQDFEAVVGLDSAEKQIEHAAARPNITYRQAPAEATGLPDQSVDLVTAAQCMHWFQTEQFYREVRRILRPTGALAVWGYMPTHIYFRDSEEAGEVLRQFHPRVHSYFHPNRQHFLLHHYEGQEPSAADFGIVKTRVVDMERWMTVEQIVGWVRSMSCWPNYIAQHGEAAQQDLLGALETDLLAALKVPDARTPVTSVWPLTVILAKHPVPL